MLHVLESWTLDQSFGLLLLGLWIVMLFLLLVWRDQD